MRFGGLLAATLLVAIGCDRGGEPSAPARAGTVTVVVRGEVERTLELPDVAEGATVEDVMRRAADEGLPVEISGRGMTALVTSIDGREMGGGEGWIYRIDGEFPSRGIGAMELQPPTTVEWSYGEWQR